MHRREGNAKPVGTRVPISFPELGDCTACDYVANKNFVNIDREMSSY